MVVLPSSWLCSATLRSHFCPRPEWNKITTLNTPHVSVHNYHRFCTDICMYVLYYVVT